MSETTHRIPVANDESVAAVHHETTGTDWIVFCHGFLSDKSGSYEQRCRYALEHGYNAVRFDFRGCGESDGTFLEQTLSSKLADLRAVVDYFDIPSYVCFGSSFGGKVAFHAAIDDERIEALVTRAPVTANEAFDSYRSSVERGGVLEFETGDRIDGRFFDDLERHRFGAVVDGLSVPVAIFHGRADDSVGIEHSIDAVCRLETDVLLDAFAGEGHRFTRAGERRLRQRMIDWLDTLA
ncbi:Alpha/beta hydrolase family protein [Natronorubrum sediminis]|uniref:Palmitoyl-protein thioesterase ABHD10, mitochondrial n=1 Tax=Natronorubrum sediminis TaxID=640943 RepID=A0A1H6G5W5_9EURY|nr:alpha/beta hydrolase [Natronorubrum sediminis]SEH18010.1 Alpha/beta hydrolase family protein [Natronorubrum sediminis]